MNRGCLWTLVVIELTGCLYVRFQTLQREEMQYRSIIDRRVSSIIIEFEYRVRERLEEISPVENAPLNER